MSSDPLDRMTGLLRGAIADAGDVEAMPAGRPAAVARIEEALRARAEERRRRRLYGRLAAAAAVLVLVGGGAAVASRFARSHGPPSASTEEALVTFPNGGVTVTQAGRSEEMAPGSRVGLGAELRTAASAEAQLDFETGSRVKLAGSSRVRLVEQSAHKRFALEAGSLTAKVAKLGPGERFVVTTPDSEIEVRGTQFRVSVVTPDRACGGGTPTRLEVDEGVVVVRHDGAEQRVAAGGRWPSCVTASASGAPAPASTIASTATPAIATAASPAALHDAPSAAGHPPPGHEPNGSPLRAADPSEPASHLAEQNDLFDGAVRAKRAGDAAGALAKLDRLRATYPNSPLAENAEVERFRVLASIDRRRAAEAAREYLRRRPSGFARAEAEALVAQAPRDGAAMP